MGKIQVNNYIFFQFNNYILFLAYYISIKIYRININIQNKVLPSSTKAIIKTRFCIIYEPDGLHQ